MTSPRLRYQTLEFGNTDIHLCCLRNKQEFSDPAGLAESLGISSATWPIFGVVWPSSIVLANFISDYDTSSKRVLEVGCGLALTSLILNKRNDDITATDHHPEVSKFLQRNTLLNDDATIPFERTDWADNSDTLGLFDLIVGSDLLYEDQHIELLANFLESHAKGRCEIILVDPGRGRKNKLVKRMSLLGFESSVTKAADLETTPTEFKGHIIKLNRY